MSKLDQISHLDCSNWPQGLKTIEECCNVPNLFDIVTFSNCSYQCHDSACNAKCYVDSTHIIENGKLNKASILLGISHFGPESVWDEIIQNSLDKCEDSVNSRVELEEQLIELFSCLKKEASKDCPEYQGIMGCSRVEKYVEDCHREENCEKWPKRFDINTVIACCNIPDLVSHAERRDCHNKCMFSTNTFNCTEFCAMKMERFVKYGKLNVSETKKALNENRNQSMPWEKVIDDAVEDCVKELKGKLNKIFKNSNTKTNLKVNFFLQIKTSQNPTKLKILAPPIPFKLYHFALRRNLPRIVSTLTI